MFEAGRSLFSKQDISCVPSRTLCVVQAGGNVLARKTVLAPNISILPLKIRHFSSSIFKAHDAMVSSDVVFLGSMLSPARHFLCSNQDIPCVPSRTRLKNREDGSDFHDFLTKSITSPRTFFLQIFAAPKKFSCRRFRRCRRRRRRRSVNHTSYLQHCM